MPAVVSINTLHKPANWASVSRPVISPGSVTLVALIGWMILMTYRIRLEYH